MARFGRLLTLGGLAAAAIGWFGRRRREERLAEDERLAHYRPDVPPDPVDEAGAESFPASDPPSYAGSDSSADTRPDPESETRRR